jgi:hypothetical protein
METLDWNTFSNIAIYLPNETLNVLKILHKDLVETTLKQNVFWKRKTENLLKKQLKDSKINWEPIYYCIEDAVKLTGPILYNIIIQPTHIGEVDAFKILLDNDYNPSLGYNKGINLPMEATLKGKFLILDLLLNDNRINSYTKLKLIQHTDSATILLKHPKFMKILFRDRMIIDYIKDSEFIGWAINKGYVDTPVDVLDFLDQSADNSWLLHKAISQGSFSAMKSLLDDPRIDPSVNNNIALKWATEAGFNGMPRYDIIQLLLRDRRIDPLDSTRLPNSIFSNQNYTDVVKVKIKDQVNGMVAGWCWVMNTIPDKPSYETSDDKFYYIFLKHLIRTKISLYDTIQKLIILVSSVDKPIRDSIYQATTSVLNGTNFSDIPPKHKTNLYYCFKGFLLLGFYPEYTYIEILDILRKEGATNYVLGLAAQYIGAYWGLNKLKSQGLSVSSRMSRIMSTVNDWDINWLLDN